jgi:hypothetical protein
MRKYKIGYTMETWYARIVEADSKEEAFEKFYDEVLYLKEEGAINNGEYLQDSVDVEELGVVNV